MFLKSLVILLLVMLVFSCSSNEKVKKESKKEIKKEIVNNDPKDIKNIYFLDGKRYPFTAKHSQVIEIDAVKNGKKELNTKKYDFNSDGIIDMVIYYEKDSIKKIVSDLDFDNDYDVIDYYKDKHIYKREIINHITHKPYIWISYDASSKVLKKEMDTNLDGNINQLYIYRNSILVEKRFDTNGNGKFDKIKHIKQAVKKDSDDGEK